MPYAYSRGVRIHYELRGRRDAPTLLLLRGLARSARFWLELLEPLEPHFRLVLPDNRGVGFSDAPAPPYRTEQMADDTAAVLDAAGAPRAHVCGISLGGMIAMQLALRHPHRVSRLALGCTTMGGRRATKIPWQALLTLLSGAGKPFHRTIVDTATVVLSPSYAAARPDVLERWAAIGRAEPPPLQGLVGQLLAGALHDVSRSVHKIAAPTLVFTGDDDRLIPAENSRLLAAEIPGARLEYFPGAGHDFPTEQPERFAAVLARFFEDLALEQTASA